MTNELQLRFDGNVLSTASAGKPANTRSEIFHADVEVGGTG
jgi:hypothetical protein